MDHVARAVAGDDWYCDQSVFATRCRNCTKGDTPCALHLVSEHVVREMEFIVISAVVLPEENLDSMPRALDGISVCPGVRIDEVNAVVHGVMRVTLLSETAVRTPAITNDRSVGFDPVTNDSH